MRAPIHSHFKGLILLGFLVGLLGCLGTGPQSAGGGAPSVESPEKSDAPPSTFQESGGVITPLADSERIGEDVLAALVRYGEGFRLFVHKDTPPGELVTFPDGSLALPLKVGVTVRRADGRTVPLSDEIAGPQVRAVFVPAGNLPVSKWSYWDTTVFGLQPDGHNASFDNLETGPGELFLFLYYKKDGDYWAKRADYSEAKAGFAGKPEWEVFLAEPSVYPLGSFVLTVAQALQNDPDGSVIRLLPPNDSPLREDVLQNRDSARDRAILNNPGSLR